MSLLAIAAVVTMASDKRYTDKQARKLLSRLLTIRELPTARARRVINELLVARLSDVVVNDPEGLVESVEDDALPLFYGPLFATLSGALDTPDVWPTIELKVKLKMIGPQSLQLDVSGSFVQMVTLQTYALLRLAGDRLRQCECGKLYVKVRGQKFCSGRCQKRYYMRRFRNPGDWEE